ncbi:MAG: hypothetical protein JWO89_1369 [Verrucomicrobiaceae bacterium]|nr:hypothetical protein [Verrucomicrobiaceae bacterium]
MNSTTAEILPGLAEPGTVVPPGVSYVDTAEKLAELVKRVHAVAARTPDFRSCLDTEADSLHHYQEKLCLIQLAFDNEYALIDPLAIEDMSPLIAALDLGEIWFHGADYDLTLLRRTYGWTPRQVRDTQIAARLTGSRQFGLAALVETHFQQTLSKASQKADWSRRPLSSVMLHYAVDDVRYLLELADKFQHMLEEKKRMPWFVQSCEALCAGVLARSTEPKEDRWKVQGSGKLHPRGLAVLKGLWEWRETIAQERDVPCFRIMSNKQLLDVSIAFDHGQSLSPPAGWRPRWKKEYNDVHEAVQASDPETWPQRVRLHSGRMSDKAREQLDKLCAAREQLATALELEPSLLGSRGTLEQVVAKAEGIEELMPWQRDVMAGPLGDARSLLGF